MKEVQYLKGQLRAGALEWAAREKVDYYHSKGSPSTVLFPVAIDGSHGNFYDPAWTAINADPEWRLRFQKSHSRRSCLPFPYSSSARELDSSNSSDALLMNFFCPVGAAELLAKRLGIAPSCDLRPRFGYKPGVPLKCGKKDETEVDLRLGDALCEAKLTEGSFTSKHQEVVNRYKDFEQVFEVEKLPRMQRDQESFQSYQLIRNILAAHHEGLKLFIFVHALREDLKDEWRKVREAVREDSLRKRCELVTWQELVLVCEEKHAEFLRFKYRL